MPPSPPHLRLRSLYRSLLRELPKRPNGGPLSNPSPLQRHLRTSFSTPPLSPSLSSQPSNKHTARKIQEAEQYVQYIRAQRMYVTLLERYNPGMGMDEEERVRLTARRVGMDLPVEMEVDVGRGRE
ncbi:MAG: hypothetical protein M1834_003067 [Cirrosporium novae-zelandiae]|nr:MAG: hypothetical protein M1834_003067 [Cirrosporium novae-zelandiae]